MSKKRHVVIGFLTFCLTSAIFIGATISTIPYDPWIDHNADGKINYEDLFALADHYGGEGTPINQAAVQFEGNISVPAVAFVPVDYSMHTNYSTIWAIDVKMGFGLWHFYGSDLRFGAAVELPHGANITNLTLYWYDEGTKQISLWLYGSNGTDYFDMAFCASIGNLGWGSSHDDTINSATIDNDHWSYCLMCIIPTSPSVLDTDYVLGFVLIEFEY